MVYSEMFVAIAAENFAEVVNFYQTILAQDPHSYATNRYAEFRLKSLKIGIFKPSPHHETEFQGKAGSLSLCLEVENLEAAIALVQSAGGAVSAEITQASHGRECYAYDPVGDRLILHEAPQRAKN